MTNECIEEVKRLSVENEVFRELSVEQLLYAAIAGAGIADVISTLKATNWVKWIK